MLRRNIAIAVVTIGVMPWMPSAKADEPGAAAAADEQKGRVRDGSDDRGPPRTTDGGPRGRPGSGPPDSSWRGPGRGPGGSHEHSWHRLSPEFRERDPEMARLIEQDYELERRGQQLSDEYRSAPTDKARSETLERLKESVTQHFKARQQRRELELRRLEEQLDRLRASVKHRAEEQNAIIDSRVRELIDDADTPRF